MQYVIEFLGWFAIDLDYWEVGSGVLVDYLGMLFPDIVSKNCLANIILELVSWAS